MRIPTPRGPLSTAVRDHLIGSTDTSLRSVPVDQPDDAAMALWMIYELSYGGFEDVPDEMEWDADVVALKVRLEERLEAELRSAFEQQPEQTFDELLAADDGPSIAGFVRRQATVEDVLDILRQRSVYHLKEATPQCFVLPRLAPRAAAMLAELQYDELGNGDPERIHSHLFAEAMRAAGLDAAYGAYVDEATTETLTLNNAMSLLCMNRRLRVAAMGHLAAFEATSSLPSADMARGLRRLRFDDAVAAYYDEHVEADAVHEHLAQEICAELTGGDPALEREVAFGAFVCLEVERRCAESLLEARGLAA